MGATVARGETWLALDTATDAASIALRADERVLAEDTWTTRRRHTVELAPRVHAMLDLHGLLADELAGIAVAIGPGSYTGLRISLSLAKGMSLATGVPVVGVPTLDVVAAALSAPSATRASPLLAVLQAGRGRVVAASYPGGADSGPDPRDLVVETIEQLVTRVDRGTWIAGELDRSARVALRAVGGHVLPPEASVRRAGYLAALGHARRHEAVDDAATLSPVYLGGDAPGG